MTTKVKVIKESFYKGIVQDVGNIIDYDGKNLPSWAQPAELSATRLKGIQVQKNNSVKKQKETNKENRQEEKGAGGASNNPEENNEEKKAELETLKDKAVNLGITYDDTNLGTDEAIDTLKELIAQKENQN